MESRMTIMNNEQETLDAAINFAKQLTPPAVILLEGELGAGKTCFVRGMCEGLGGDPRQVSSPTFSIMQEYEVVSAGRLVHIDAYRLSGEDELATIGWDELLEDKNVVIAIEWPSRIKNALPPDSLTIQLEHIDIQTRELLINV
ncbi:MAG TPA: tRNA (adenosine(37)-N6)-threonylcarbamoyltransferase complex ATPase subunit type 1 TsaE [Phycisphaerales bacterium]|nr:tRNA (adenosine(37)-N6)-threonylcarbamoyltransferase complex ATPase subunit type 1 TsaE [Phycisphaerales bacterium]HIB00614.1 tRNA (adenosine(37)-N6)-threonylcarbamoyltransferase complex ATPase subunit type 1 TsaE [Phycisphaerales bacterium]HIN83424.1 tRNA (adenosine(37)-N6)-threonylcarbamoyltransferase complex ATPase subunit type 1 TsaE [Phycisphaerales bacterium]